MHARFWSSFFLAAVLTLIGLGAAGFLASWLMASAPRERFVTSAFEFERAPGWTCGPDGTEYVCTVGERPHSAIAVIAQKLRGPQDTLEAYEAHLGRGNEVKRADGTTARPEIVFVRRRRLAGHEWVEALHRGSEIKNYDTHYLATVTARLGLLVTFSAHIEHRARYLAQLEEMIGSLVIYESGVR